MIKYAYRLIDKIYLELYKYVSKIYILIVFRVFAIKPNGIYRINGFPKFTVKRNGKVLIGDRLVINSGNVFNSIGRNQRSLFSVGEGAVLSIGNNVGMSSVAIVCHKRVSIGNNIRIGGNTVIYDTDFHALNAKERTAIPEIRTGIKQSEVSIGDNVFIGGHSIILKGARIGSNSIIGAGSVVTGLIPENEIWAGNPATYIRNNEVL